LHQSQFGEHVHGPTRPCSLESFTLTMPNKHQKAVMELTKSRVVTPNKGRRNKKAGALVSTAGAMASLSFESVPWMPLFPATVVKQLRYSSNFSLNSTSGVPAWYVFRANDLFDPDFSGTGHQPMGFDQMMVFYNHFCVMESYITCVFKNTSLASTVAQVGIRQDASSSTLSIIPEIIEFGGLVMDTLEGKSTYGADKCLKLALDVGKLQGVNRKALTADPTLRGDAATSPTEVTYFHVGLWDSAGVSQTCNVDVILEQRAYFMEPRDATESLRRIRQSPGRPPEEAKTYVLVEKKTTG